MSGTSRAWLLLLPGLALAAGAARAGSPSTPPPHLVPCDQVILGAGFPDPGYRVVLGAVAVPPAYLRQIGRIQGPWPYWRKAGLVVRANRGPVAITVPRAWRSRVAFIWGNSGGPFATLRIARCPPAEPGKRGNAYAGGFYLRSRSACVPLVFRVGSRSATVWFGLGRRCPRR